jgi:hypothetical protein
LCRSQALNTDSARPFINPKHLAAFPVTTGKIDPHFKNAFPVGRIAAPDLKHLEFSNLHLALHYSDVSNFTPDWDNIIRSF